VVLRIPLLDHLALAAARPGILRFLHQRTQFLDVLVELVVVPSDHVALLLQVLVVVFEMGLAYLAVV
jgi:hypothetical protein